MAATSDSKPLCNPTAAAATISTVHTDILETHILTRLDGPTLASAACTSSQLYALASQEPLWSNICHSTWPSTTTTPRLRRIISTFPPHGPRSFFSASFTNPDPAPPTSTAAKKSSLNHHLPSELISAVDIHYGNSLIFSKVVETETVTDWFFCSPFRIDLLDPKDTVATFIGHPETEDACRGLVEGLTLSWILADPTGRLAMNLSSHRPVSVQRHWLSGEVHVRFASVLVATRGSSSGGEVVRCGINVITCGGSHGGEMHVREVSLLVEDLDGMQLNGRDSLVILQRGLEEGKRVKWEKREVECMKRYGEFLEMKRVRKERKLRAEGTLDSLCVAFGVFAFASLVTFLIFGR